MLIVVSLVTITVFYFVKSHFWEEHESSRYFGLLLLLPFLNTLMIFAVGRYVLSGILYPY